MSELAYRFIGILAGLVLAYAVYVFSVSTLEAAHQAMCDEGSLIQELCEND